MTTTRPLARRPAFTLVELLVATALCILIMVIITEAFGQGMRTFSHMKSLGDLQSRLRSAGDIVRGDLQAIHLEDDRGQPMRVSKVRLDRCDLTQPDSFRGVLPKKGFFRVTQESAINTTVVDYTTPTSPKLFTAAYQMEGSDPDGLASSRARDHVLHMTVRRPNEPFLGGVPSTTASPITSPWPLATAPTSPTTPRQNEFLKAHNTSLTPGYGTAFSSEWAEVSYFIDYTNQTGQTATGQPTYPLVRRVRVLSDRKTGLDWAGNNLGTSVTGGPNAVGGRLSDYQGMSFTPVGTAGVYELNDAAAVTNPANRLGWTTGTRTVAEFGTLSALGAPVLQWQQYAILAGHRDYGSPGFPLFGDDIVMTNVTSFEIKLDYENIDPTSNVTFGSIKPGSTEAPYHDLPVRQATVGLNSTLNTVNRRVFDTWYDNGQTVNTGTTVVPQWAYNTGNNNNPEAQRVPAFIRVKSIQIKLRAYDPNNKLSRQITLISDL